MAASKGGMGEIKKSFITKEGCYKLMDLSEYSRPNKVPYTVQQCHPVRVSFVTVKDQGGCNDRLAFNIGRELYFYIYKGVRKAADLTKPMDKRVYKGTIPTCHDFNMLTRSSESLELLVGFSYGQVQLLDPIRHEVSKLFNEERNVDKSRVTCLKWIPGSENLFLVSHESGNMYVYNKEHPPGLGAPQYALMKQGPDFTIDSGKSKTPRNPVCKWTVGKGGITEFSFSPDCKHIAIVSRDGFLRVFDFDNQSLYGVMKSYFGALTCVSWSPDGKYIVVGGEDDLVTVWSFHERRVIARGHGHNSWVSVVAFDPYTTYVAGGGRMDDSDEEDIEYNGIDERSTNPQVSADKRDVTCYRFGSVGEDTMLCLWDLSEDVLRTQRPRARSVRTTMSGMQPPGSSSCTHMSNSLSNGPLSNDSSHVRSSRSHSSCSHSSHTYSGHWGNSVAPVPSEPVKNLTQIHSLTKSVENLLAVGTMRPGTSICPRLDEVPMLEPLIVKKIAHERLTTLVFREDCVVTACQEGFICTWARPGKVGISQSTGTVV